MIKELFAWSIQQPFLVGGVGTVLASSLMYLLRSVPTKINRFIYNSLSSHLTVNSQNNDFTYLDAYLQHHIIPWTFRNFEPAEKDSEDRDGEAYLNTGYGNGWGYWEGVWFSFGKEIDKTNMYQPLKTIKINFFTRDKAKISKFVGKAVEFRRGVPKQRLYLSSGNYWERGADRRLRPMNTVFANAGVLEEILIKTQDFLDREDWYLQRGIPYKFAVFFYGEPGTGKTSIIHAISSHFHLDIMYVTALGNLKHLMEERSHRRSVVVIEDIDALAQLQRKNEDEDKDEDKDISLSGIGGKEFKLSPSKIEPINVVGPTNPILSPLHDTLNSIDGFPSRHGSIIFITSNHPENLDHALLRDGRIDLLQEIGPLDWEAATRMYHAFYPNESSSGWDSLREIFQPIVGASLQADLMNVNPIGKLRRRWSPEKGEAS